MKGLQHLLSCGQVLGVLLFLSVCVSVEVAGEENGIASTTPSHLTTDGSSVSEATSQMDETTFSQLRSSGHTSSSPGPKTTSMPGTARTSTKATTTTTTTTASAGILSYKDFLTVLMVTGGLTIACVIFLTSTLLLAWKVCQLSRRIKTLSINDDLVSNSEYWMGTAKKNKSKSETEAVETTVLMADVQQTQEEKKKNGAVKEDGQKVNEDGQKEEGKQAGDPAPSNEASAAENSSSKPQKEAADSKSPSAEAASPSEGTEQAKDGK